MLGKGSSENAPDMVSIIMPAFNAAIYVESSIRSVLKQTYPDWELIIINDASTDDTLAKVTSHSESDSRIKVIDLAENVGVAAARNRGLEAAIGKYIAFLDSDDQWANDKLSKQVNYMESNGALITYGAYRRVDESGREIGIVLPPDVIGYKDLLKSNFIGNLTGMYNAQELGKQYFSAVKHEDYVAWLKILKRTKSASAVGGILGDYRVYSGSTSSNKLKAATWQWRIYREAESLGLLSSAMFMIFYTYYAIKKRL